MKYSIELPAMKLVIDPPTGGANDQLPQAHASIENKEQQLGTDLPPKDNPDLTSPGTKGGEQHDGGGGFSSSSGGSPVRNHSG